MTDFYYGPLDQTAWDTTDPMVGERVAVYTSYGEVETATVLAVSRTTDLIRVRSDKGDILIGNSWDSE